MSEDLHNIDKLFKAALEKDDDVPSGKVWDNIDKNLDKKRVVFISEKYKRLKWVAAALLLFSVGMAMYAVHSRLKNREIVKRNNLNKKKSFSNNKPSVNINDNNSTIKPSISEEQSRETIAGKGAKEPRGNNVDKGTGKDISIVNNASSSKSVNRKVVGKDVSLNDKRRDVAEQQVSKDDRKPNSEVIKKGGYIEAGSIAKGTKDILKNIDGEKKATIDNVVGDRSSDIRLYGEVVRANDDVKNIQTITPAAKLSDAFKSFFDKRTGTNEDNTGKTNKKIKLPSTQGPRFSASIFYSPDFISMKVENDRPRFREDDRNEIRRNEHAKVSSTYGALIAYNFNRKWSAETGLTLSTRVTDIQPKAIFARPDERGNIKYRLSSSAGYCYVDVKSGSAPRPGDSLRSLSATNTLKYLGIPLTIRYIIGFGKFSLQPSVGLSANFLTKGTIETVISAPGGRETVKTNDIKGLKSSYISGSAGVGASYSINKAIDLNFRPTARFALSSINKGAPVKTYLNSVGLATGLTIKF